MGIVFAVCLVLVAVGLTTVISWVAPSVGGPVTLHPPRPFFALLWLFVLLALFRRLMGRFGFPLGNMIEAADRVAAGDYSTRTPEYGPRWMRTLARAFNSMTAKLEVQDRQRRDLMADIAHELRTPLAVLQGRVEGMLDGIYPRDEGQLAAVLQDTRMLARLVEDLRTLAHTESGTLALQKEPTDPAILVNDTAASFAGEAVEHRIQLDVDAAPNLPLVDIDPVRIREVLTNLVSNAFRHTPAGGRITMTVTTQANRLVITVRDTGAGIPVDDLPRVFDRFYKGHGSRGSGLGLTIARNLVAAHGGDHRAESVEGTGTTMTVTLPTKSISVRLQRPPRRS
jgi:two-component system OmpR family sensor kinase/two-component system sensor histidine kinase BaeS